MKQNSLKIYMFNVGSGDHLMIEFPDSSIAIIDSFFSDAKLELQEPPAVTYLKYRLIKKINNKDTDKIKIAFICLSHADHDHIKDINILFKLLSENAEHIELENLWLFGGIDFDLYKEELEKLNIEFRKHISEDAQEEFDKCANRFNNELTTIQGFKKAWTSSGNSESYFNDFKEFNKYNSQRPYKAYSVGPLARIINDQQNISVSKLISSFYERVQLFQNKMLSDESLKMNLKFNRNSISAILAIQISGRCLLFLGDATSQTIEASLNDILNKRSDAMEMLFNPSFVKVAHHGAKSSTTQEIWNKLFTKKCDKIMFGISAGEHKKFRHPNSELFEHLQICSEVKNVSHKIYRTNECASCSNKYHVDGIMDLDFWFKFHGCKLTDKRLEDALNEVAPELVKNTADANAKNLLAYVFEFTENDAKVYKGVSNLIGRYADCVFVKKKACYC